jgi:phospholipid/cholesterol/gamma-HCH transport system substrate-binding protein
VLTSRISRIEPSQEQQVVAILANVRQITEQTKQALGAVNNVINAQQGQVGAAMEQVREALRKLDATLASAENISKNIEQGNGVVGKLLTDKDLADRVSHSLTGVTSYIDRLTGLQIEAGMRASIGLQPLGHGRFAYPSIAQVDAKIIPANSSRYIGVSVVSDSQGNYQHAVTSQQINGEPLTTLTDTYTETLRVSAYLAQMLGPVTFRAGLIESTGGVGVDWDIIPNTLSLHADAFDFTPPVPNVWPTLRVYGQYTFAKHFDLYAGGDDLINNPFPNPDPSKVLTSYGRYAFAGVGFHFTDDDLKAILSLTGVPK